MVISRDIPENVKLELRQEVNWGCPVHNCGSPFLSYHHFDPPFSKFKPGQMHDPKGMIALCLAHAKKADGGVWTNQQLLEMKSSPFLSSGQVSGRLEWLRQDIIIRFGGMTCIRPRVILEVFNKPYIWVNRDTKGNMLLNMDIPSRSGTPMIRMDQNDWHIYGNISNLEATPGGRSIEVRVPQEGFSLTMNFKDLNQAELQAVVEAKAEKYFKRQQKRHEADNQLLPPELAKLLSDSQPSPEEEFALAKQNQWKLYNDSINSWPALEVTLTGILPGPSPIKLTPDAMRLGGSTFIDSAVFGGGVAISIH